jgi:hypothetical protein
MKFKHFAVIAALSITLIWGMQSCQHESMGDPNAAICFERDILPIFNSKCASSGCHDANSSAEGYVLDSYKHITKSGISKGRPNSSELYTIIVDGEMPPKRSPKLTNDEVNLIHDWIAAGAKNGINCVSRCDSSQFTFSKSILPLMNKYCVGCHSTGNSSAAVDVSSYAGVKSSISKGLMKSLDHTGYYPMPKGGSKLSDCEINQVKNWINAGALNN